MLKHGLTSFWFCLVFFCSSYQDWVEFYLLKQMYFQRFSVSLVMNWRGVMRSSGCPSSHCQCSVAVLCTRLTCMKIKARAVYVYGWGKYKVSLLSPLCEWCWVMVGTGLAPGVLRSLLQWCEASLCFRVSAALNPGLVAEGQLGSCLSKALFFFFSSFNANCSHCIFAISAVCSSSLGFLLIWRC